MTSDESSTEVPTSGGYTMGIAMFLAMGVLYFAGLLLIGGSRR